MGWRQRWIGALAAFGSASWVTPARLPELLSTTDAWPPTPVPEPHVALRTARRLLRVLARLPGHRWRAGCLHESVAECLVLRRWGVPAVLCIGVKRGADGRPGLEAHAWVARSESDRRFHGFATMAVLDELRAQR